MATSYRVISSVSTGIYKDKGSRFLSFAHPAKDKNEIAELINQYKKEHHKARHVCYAYMLGSAREDFRVNDDGEPSGTAGRPILGQINSRELTDILVVVVRYFGGTLLGTGGLITAYKEAAADALNQATIVEKDVLSRIHIQFDYPAIETVMQAIKNFQVEIIQQEFLDSCSMQLFVPLSNKSDLISSIEKLVEIDIVF